MASALFNGHANGLPTSKRFSDVPNVLDIPVQDQEDEAVEIDLTNLVDDPSDLCDLFETEHAARTYWMAVALAYAKQKRVDYAIEMLIRGGTAMQNINPREKLSIVSCLCWMYLWKSREAPRTAPDGQLASEVKTKEYYLQLATSTLNEASRINPAFPPLFLARGVLYLLRASLQPPSKSGGAGAADPEKAELLRSALKSFEDAIRVSHGKNMLAVMGKARALYSLGKYSEALSGYQQVLSKMPDLIDPDPRIGIGCCFWQLGFKDDAKAAWERCLEVNPDSKIANILLGLHYLDASAHVPTNSPEFIRLYKKAMTEYTQKSFKLDKEEPLTCATFAGFFLSRKHYANVDSLAHKAIHYTDVNAIASDGWYLLARKEHYAGDAERAAAYYKRADEARGGDASGYLPAKFGTAQLQVLKNDLPGARYHLDKMIKQARTHEAMTLLGTIFAEDIFANQYAAVKEDKSNEAKSAIMLLEGVRNAWKDPKRNLAPDASVLLNLARLYEVDHPDKALQCLLQVEQMELDQVPASEYPTDLIVDDSEKGSEEAKKAESAKKAALRKFLPPQLLNNIGCFYSQAEKHQEASEMFEAALGACVKIGEKDEDMDTDALVTTISFNLGRSYESQGLADQAVDVYEGLMKRHDDYTDAQARLAYIKLRKNPNTKEGPDAVAKLYEDNRSDLEVRALYGWFLGRINSRKKPSNILEDSEFKHYKHTLQNYDKHDRYALVGMGNMWLMSAREMRRETDADKSKRSVTYGRAVEFFEKALQLDPKNAYAASGIAIALAEDKKDYKSALQILLQVRETVKTAHIYINLGHTYAELRQFSKAIESYEIALSKEGKSNDPTILACLGRVWLNKGRSSQAHSSSQRQTTPDLTAYHKALECAKKALEIAPEQVHFKFNVAFVQIQLASTIYNMKDTERSLQQLEEAAAGLESAIEALDEIATSPQTPYPKHDVEQRANMARNTQRKQLERAIAHQKEYEEKNKEKIAAALEQRQAEVRRREEEKQKILKAEEERKEKIRKEREEIAARDRKAAQERAEEERARLAAEMTTDSETGEKVKRKRKPAARSGGEPRAAKGRSRRKKRDDGDEGDESEVERQPKKKRRLTTKKDSNKYKSAEIVVDSDEDEDALDAAEKEMARGDSVSELSDIEDPPESDVERMDVDKPTVAGEEAASRPKRSRRARVLDESEDEDGEGDIAIKSPDGDGIGGTPASAAQEGGYAAEANLVDTSMVDADDDE